MKEIFNFKLYRIISNYTNLCREINLECLRLGNYFSY